MPERVYKPMLAERATEWPRGARWGFEKKFDGNRVLNYVVPDREHAVLLSRNQSPYTNEYPDIAYEMVAAFAGHAIVADSELVHIVVGPDNEERDSLRALQKRQGEPRAYVFDLLELDGQRLMGWPLWRRRQHLESIFKSTPHVRLSEMFSVNQGRLLFDAVVARGGEGVMAKRLSSHYLEDRRTKDWQKIKPGYGIPLL
jgi:bifunctional non-homologous end joining protein LigD